MREKNIKGKIVKIGVHSQMSHIDLQRYDKMTNSSTESKLEYWAIQIPTKTKDDLRCSRIVNKSDSTSSIPCLVQVKIPMISLIRYVIFGEMRARLWLRPLEHIFIHYILNVSTFNMVVLYKLKIINFKGLTVIHKTF